MHQLACQVYTETTCHAPTCLPGICPWPPPLGQMPFARWVGKQPRAMASKTGWLRALAWLNLLQQLRGCWTADKATTGKMPYAYPATSILCEPAQSKCTWTCHKSHFGPKFTGKMPDAPDTTLIEHRPFTVTVRTPRCGHTVWGTESTYRHLKWQRLKIRANTKGRYATKTGL